MVINDTTIQAAEERLQRLRERKAQQDLDAQLAEKMTEFKASIQKAVSSILKSTGMELPAKGVYVYVSRNEDGKLSIEVNGPKGHGRRANGNPNRATLAALGYDGFVLPDGREPESPAAVLEAMGVPYYGHGGGDSPQREIVKWAKANPDKAKQVLVKVGEEAVSLDEAVKKL